MKLRTSNLCPQWFNDRLLNFHLLLLYYWLNYINLFSFQNGYHAESQDERYGYASPVYDEEEDERPRRRISNGSAVYSQPSQDHSNSSTYDRRVSQTQQSQEQSNSGTYERRVSQQSQHGSTPQVIFMLFLEFDFRFIENVLNLFIYLNLVVMGSVDIILNFLVYV